jgi:uncharacterized membrane protein YeaQ/YmgE (transglycosylase-associated protein family)
MIGMTFQAFVTCLILGIIAAIVMHSLVRYRMVGGGDGFVAKWIAGWLGAWLGSPVLGHWWVHVQNVYIIPALIGAFIGAFALAYLTKAQAVATGTVLSPKVVTTTGVVPEMARKAS